MKIETPGGHGTGFLCSYNEDKTLCAVATAEHVVAEADKWQQPIRIHNHNFTKTRLLKEGERFILREGKNDSAAILFHPGDFDFPESLIQLRPKEEFINIGNEVGWLGYPAMYEWTMCFFSGCISARPQSGYLIDGVAINGVSGGPVVYSPSAEVVQFVGVISAYHANRNLPGLLIAQDVSHFHNVIAMVKTLDEARRAQAEEEAKKKQAASAAGTPSPSESSPPPEQAG